MSARALCNLQLLCSANASLAGTKSGSPGTQQAIPSKVVPRPMLHKALHEVDRQNAKLSEL
eukprot:294749-Amphidinium_carterae.1